jgi:aminopeptidase YwaD
MENQILLDVAEIVGTAVYDSARFNNQAIKPKKGLIMKADPELKHEKDLK